MKRCWVECTAFTGMLYLDHGVIPHFTVLMSYSKIIKNSINEKNISIRWFIVKYSPDSVHTAGTSFSLCSFMDYRALLNMVTLSKFTTFVSKT